MVKLCKMRRKCDYSQIIHLLQQLHTAFPHYNMGRHLATALDEYGDVWGMTDKEIAFALRKYKSQLELDFPHYVESDEIERIVKDGMDLDSLFKEEEEHGN